MGQVIVRYRILPDSPENFEALKKNLEALEPASMEEEPIAFTLKAIKFTKLIEDGPGTEDALEQQVKETKHVESVETLSVTRTL